MKSLLSLMCLGIVSVLSVHLLGQTVALEPLELRQSAATVNVSSFRRIAPSNSSDTPADSGKRALEAGSATPHRSPSVMSFGGGVRIGGSPTHAPTLKTNQSLLENAVSLNLPRLGGSNPTHVLLRARIGSPVSAVTTEAPAKVVADLTVRRGDVSSAK